MGRLYITGKMGDATYNQLRAEWQEKLRRVELELAELDRDASIHLDDLDAALALLAKISDLYPRLEENQRSTLLQILVKRIIVDANGEIIDYGLNSPFVYLRSLVQELSTPGNANGDPEPPIQGAYRIDTTRQNYENLDHFVAGLRFEQRGKLEIVAIKL